MRKITTEEFIKKAKKVHGNKYNYSKMEYKNHRTMILIICEKHGVFPQTPSSHLQGHGCPNCGGLKTTNKFIEDAKKIHGDKYNYSKVKYIGGSEKVEIMCPKHGVFLQTPHAHLRGQGCRKCSGTYKKTTKEFIEDAKKVHGDKYDYSKTIYKNKDEKVIIICPKHGEFEQIPGNHLKKHGCRKCAGNNKKTTDELIEDAKRVHGNKYDYSKVLYTGDGEKITIICPKHGEFTQSANGHLSGKGCFKCCRLYKNTEDFIKQAKSVHGNKYDYSKVNYINGRTKVIIICPKHGEFPQIPGNHIHGQCCPKCNGNVSIISQKWLDMCGVPKDCREITIRCGRKRYIVDGYIEQTNTIYEFNGDFWHGNPEKYDPNKINPIIKKSYRELYKITIDKKKLFEKNGYKVIDIWESDFKENGETQ